MTTCTTCFGTFGTLWTYPDNLNLKPSPFWWYLPGCFFQCLEDRILSFGGISFRPICQRKKFCGTFQGVFVIADWEKSSWALFFMRRPSVMISNMDKNVPQDDSWQLPLKRKRGVLFGTLIRHERKSSPFPKVGGEAFSADPSFIIYLGWLAFPIRVPLQNFGPRFWVDTMIYCRKTGSDDWISHKKKRLLRKSSTLQPKIILVGLVLLVQICLRCLEKVPNIFSQLIVW